MSSQNMHSKTGGNYNVQYMNKQKSKALPTSSIDIFAPLEVGARPPENVTWSQGNSGPVSVTRATDDLSGSFTEYHGALHGMYHHSETNGVDYRAIEPTEHAQVREQTIKEHKSSGQ